MNRKCGQSKANYVVNSPTANYVNSSHKQNKIIIILSTVRPVSADVKDIDVSMVITGQKGVSCGVKGHVEETHRLGLLSSADHRDHQAEEDKNTCWDDEWIVAAL